MGSCCVKEEGAGASRGAAARGRPKTRQNGGGAPRVDTRKPTGGGTHGGGKKVGCPAAIKTCCVSAGGEYDPVADDDRDSVGENVHLMLPRDPDEEVFDVSAAADETAAGDIRKLSFATRNDAAVTRYTDTVRACQRTGRPWSDPNFTTDGMSFGPGVGRGIHWIREFARTGERAVVPASLKPWDLRQGKLGNCPFITSLAAIATYDVRLIQRLFRDDIHDEVAGGAGDGVYAIQFCRAGAWETVLVDDRIPCFETREAGGHGQVRFALHADPGRGGGALPPPPPLENTSFDADSVSDVYSSVAGDGADRGGLLAGFGGGGNPANPLENVYADAEEVTTATPSAAPSPLLVDDTSSTATTATTVNIMGEPRAPGAGMGHLQTLRGAPPPRRDLSAGGLARAYVPAFVRSDGGAWAALLEKAYAKFYGNYADINAGNIAESMYDLTGFPVESLDLKPATRQTQSNVLHAVGKRAVNLWEQGCVMTLGMPLFGTAQHAVAPNGLVSGHAYAVLDIVNLADLEETTGFGRKRLEKRLQQAAGADAGLDMYGQDTGLCHYVVKLYNPWGTQARGVWRGLFDRECNVLPKDVKDHKRLRMRALPNGVFCMPLHEVIINFEVLNAALPPYGPDDTLARIKKRKPLKKTNSFKGHTGTADAIPRGYTELDGRIAPCPPSDAYAGTFTTRTGGGSKNFVSHRHNTAFVVQWPERFEYSPRAAAKRSTSAPALRALRDAAAANEREGSQSGGSGHEGHAGCRRSSTPSSGHERKQKKAQAPDKLHVMLTLPEQRGKEAPGTITYHPIGFSVLKYVGKDGSSDAFLRNGSFGNGSFGARKAGAGASPPRGPPRGGLPSVFAPAEWEPVHHMTFWNKRDVAGSIDIPNDGYTYVVVPSTYYPAAATDYSVMFYHPRARVHPVRWEGVCQYLERTKWRQVGNHGYEVALDPACCVRSAEVGVFLCQEPAEGGPATSRARAITKPNTAGANAIAIQLKQYKAKRITSSTVRYVSDTEVCERFTLEEGESFTITPTLRNYDREAIPFELAIYSTARLAIQHHQVMRSNSASRLKR